MRRFHPQCGVVPVSMLLLVAVLVSPIRMQAAEQKSERIVLESRGYLVPATQITVAPKVAGQVVELSVEEGQAVKAGDVLARLDAEEFKAALALAQARLKLSEAELVKAKDTAAPAEVTIAEAKVAVARAEVAVAQHHVECTVIRAPISGLVLAKRAEVGARIDPQAAQAAASLCDMADLRNMDVEVWIAERDLPKIAKGQACVILVDAFPNATYRGHVFRIGPSGDRARGAVAVRVRLDTRAASDGLAPELSAVVQFCKAKD